jgi:hypothetical protein
VVTIRNAGSGIERNLTDSPVASAQRLITSGKLIVSGPKSSCTWPDGPSSPRHRAAISQTSCTEMGDVGRANLPARFATPLLTKSPMMLSVMFAGRRIVNGSPD